MTTAPAAYCIHRLCKTYLPAKVKANVDISLSIRPGEVFGLFGPNGAGKTTLVKQMGGLTKPTSGQILLLGQDIVAQPALVPHYVAYYGQRVLALKCFRFREVLLHTAILRGASRAEASRISTALIDRFELGSIADSIMMKLSGGQQRQAALLASFVGDRPILMLDEPTNELDPAMRRRIWDYLDMLNRENGTTIILVTHNVLEAEQVVDRVAIIDRGHVVALGTPGELKQAVDASVRVEVRTRSGAGNHVEERLLSLSGCARVREGQYRIKALREQATEVFQTLVSQVGLDALDDFRLMTPSLEDVYLHYTAVAGNSAAEGVCHAEADA